MDSRGQPDLIPVAPITSRTVAGKENPMADKHGAAQEIVYVEHHPGQRIKLARKDAEAYVAANSGSKIVEMAPAAKPEAEKAEVAIADKDAPELVEDLTPTRGEHAEAAPKAKKG